MVSTKEATIDNIIVADDQAVFRAGSAKILGAEDGLRIIAQCPDSGRLNDAVKSFHESIIIVACSMSINLKQVLVNARAVGSRVIAIAENSDQISRLVPIDLDGLIYRNVTSAGLVDCVRRVVRGERIIDLRGPNYDVGGIDQVGVSVWGKLQGSECSAISQ